MSIEEAIKGYTSLAQKCAKTGWDDSACEYKQIANWLQELKERRERESRGINLAKPYVTIQVDKHMVNRMIDKTIDNLYFECKNCGQKMFPQRKEEES